MVVFILKTFFLCLLFMIIYYQHKEISDLSKRFSKYIVDYDIFKISVYNKKDVDEKFYENKYRISEIEKQLILLNNQKVSDAGTEDKTAGIQINKYDKNKDISEDFKVEEIQ
jgi:hypothetical protein